jgi:hypothetical protein
MHTDNLYKVMMTRGIVLSVLLHVLYSSALRAENDLWLDELDLVSPVTITHLKQNPHDVSASVTLFTREDIKRQNFRDWYDLLRAVPGMKVNKGSSPAASVEHAAGGLLLGRGMEILLNGVAQTVPAHASIVLDFLPPIETVETVEIVRGTNAAADGGSRSFKGSIRIVTLQAQLNHTSSLRVADSSDGYRYGFLYWNPKLGESTDGRHHLSVSAFAVNDPGFDRRDPAINTEQAAFKPRVEEEGQYANALFDYQWLASSRTQWAFSAYYMHGDFRVPGLAFVPEINPALIGALSLLSDVDLNAEVQPRDTDSVMDNAFVSSSVDHAFNDYNQASVSLSYQRWNWRQSWHVCGPRLALHPSVNAFLTDNADQVVNVLNFNLEALRENPAFWSLMTDLVLANPAEGLEVVCGQRPLDTVNYRSTLRMQNVTSWRDWVSWVYGIERSESGSEMVMRSSSRYQELQAYSHLMLASRYVTANIGYRLDRFDRYQGASSRLGLNWHYADNKTFRVVSSRSEKLPDIADINNDFGGLLLTTEEAHYGKTLHEIYDGGALAKNTDNQVIFSREVGFLWTQGRDSKLDVRLFRDRYENISFYDLFLTDLPETGRISKTGLELQYSGKLTSILPLDKGSFGLNTHVHNSISREDEHQYRSFGAKVFVQYPFSDDLAIAVNVYKTKISKDIDGYDADFHIEIAEASLARYFASAYFGGPQGRRPLRIMGTVRYDTSNYISRLQYPDYYSVSLDDALSLRLTLDYEF